MKCLNRNTLEYQMLTEVSGVQGFALDAQVRYHLDNFGRYPYLDEIVGADSSKALLESAQVKETQGVKYAKLEDLQNLTGKTSIEEINAELNNKFRDLEIQLIDLDDAQTLIRIKHRPSENVYIDNGIDISKDKVNSKNAIVRSINKLTNLYGIKINEITIEELNTDEWQGKVPDAVGANAFIYNGEIYINTSIIEGKSDEPKVHELLHMFLGAMRYQDPSLYFKLVQSMEQLPLSPNDALQKTRSHSDVLEETFVSQYAKYLTNQDSIISQLPEQVLNDINYNIRRALDSVLMGNYSVRALEDSEIMCSTLSQLATRVESDLYAAKFPQFINAAAVHRKVANTKQGLIDSNQLREDCV